MYILHYLLAILFPQNHKNIFDVNYIFFESITILIQINLSTYLYFYTKHDLKINASKQI